MANFATITQIKTYLGNVSPEDEILLTSLLTRTTKLIQNYVGRDLVQTTYTNIRRNGNGERVLQVQHYPIISVTNIYDDVNRVFGSDTLLIEDTGGLYSTAHYVIAANGEVENPGEIIRLDGAWTKGLQNIKMTYVGGYSDANMPADLVQAQIDWVTYIFKNKDIGSNVSSYRLGDFSVALKSMGGESEFGNINPIMPPDNVRLVLDTYRDPRMESTCDENYGLE